MPPRRSRDSALSSWSLSAIDLSLTQCRVLRGLAQKLKWPNGVCKERKPGAELNYPLLIEASAKILMGVRNVDRTD